MLSKTRSLRHIHVALGLRHPWLRTVLESSLDPRPRLMSYTLAGASSYYAGRQLRGNSDLIVELTSRVNKLLGLLLHASVHR